MTSITDTETYHNLLTCPLFDTNWAIWDWMHDLFLVNILIPTREFVSPEDRVTFRVEANTCDQDGEVS